MISSEEILKAKILIVDDQEANILLMDQLLRQAGYTEITSSRAPFPVRELHRKNHYDLILLDLQMPGMDGFQVMDGLKEVEPGAYLPVLVVTAQPEHRMRAVRAGAKDFISKPFDIPELLHRVHTMLEVRLLHAKLIKQAASPQPRPEEAHFRLAAHIHTDMVWDWDLRDQTLWWSDDFLTPFGFKAGEIEPNITTWNFRIHPEDRAGIIESLDHAIAGAESPCPESWCAEYRLQRKDGSYAIVQDRAFIIRDPAGKALRMVGGLRDITEQKTAEAAKRHARIMEAFGARTGDIARALSGLLPEGSPGAALIDELLSRAEASQKSPDRLKASAPGLAPDESAV
jgi:PAS domain S-box-containing protein